MDEYKKLSQCEEAIDGRQLFERLSTDKAAKEALDHLGMRIAKQIYNLNEGEVSQPFVMMDQQKNREVCAIVKLKKKTDVHRANLTDDFQTIRSMLESKLSAEYIHDWILKKQQSTFIQISPEWQGCDFEYPGWIH